MLHSTIHPLLIVFALGVTAFVEGPDRDEQRKLLATGDELPVSAWVRELKSLSLAYRPKTEIDRADEEPKFIERVSQTLDKKVLKVTGTVKSFTWKDGDGFVTVKVAGVSKSDRVSLLFSDSFIIRIDKEDAKTFPIGQSFELRAVTEFVPGINARVNSSKSQFIARVNGPTKNPWIGGFRTNVYQIKIGGKEYQGAWEVGN